ncbi:hypothetical protein MHYP_G00251170 [Metynnis hypsauchen]
MLRCRPRQTRRSISCRFTPLTHALASEQTLPHGRRTSSPRVLGETTPQIMSSRTTAQERTSTPRILSVIMWFPLAPISDRSRLIIELLHLNIIYPRIFKLGLG